MKRRRNAAFPSQGKDLEGYQCVWMTKDQAILEDFARVRSCSMLSSKAHYPIMLLPESSRATLQVGLSNLLFDPERLVRLR